MSASSRPVPAPAASLSSSGFADGLGRRVLAFDREEGVMLERLVLRPELAAFEPMLRERLERLASLEDERIARPRTIERTPDGGLVVASEYVPGMRLSDLLHPGAAPAGAAGLDAAFGLLLDVLPAFCGLHAGAGFAHGTVAPCRIVLTPGGQVVLLDALYGGPLSLLRYSRRRLWRDFGIAAPWSSGAPRLDVHTDIGQAALVATMLSLGRPMGDHDYPHGLIALLAEVFEVAQIRASAPFAAGFGTFLERALHLGGHQPYGSADDALIAVRELAGEIGIPVCRRALLELVEGSPSGNVDAQPAADGEFSYQIIDDEADPYDGRTIDASPAEGDLEIDAGAEIDLDALATEPGTDHQQHTGEFGEHPGCATEAERGPDQLADAPAAAEPALPSEPGDRAPEPEPEGTDNRPPALRQRRAKRSRSARARKDKLRSAASEDAPLLAGPVVPPPPTPAPTPAPGPWLVAPARAAAFEPPVPGAPGPADAPLALPARAPSYAAPPPPPAPTYLSPPVYVPPAAAMAPPLPAAYAPPIPWSPPALPPAPVVLAPRPAPLAAVRLKDPTPRPRVNRAAAVDIYATPPPPVANRRRAFPWKRAGVAVAVLATGLLAGRAYLAPPGAEPDTARQPIEITAAVPPRDVAGPKPGSASAGIVEIETQPAGARVLLNGKPAGETPLTLERVPAGRHTFTFVSSAGTVKRTVRVEGGRTLKLDVPIFSGWVGIFAPIVLDVAVGRQTLGTTEEPRLMLSPGRHELTLTNRALGYRSVQSVDIEPGEVRTLTLDPRGTANLNAEPWAEVLIDGEKIGDTPLAHVQLPLGTREVLFRHPQLGERRVTITVKGNAPVSLSVDMNQPGG